MEDLGVLHSLECLQELRKSDRKLLTGVLLYLAGMSLIRNVSTFERQHRPKHNKRRHTWAMYVMSKAPQCVAPSAPTKPARSIANRTVASDITMSMTTPQHGWCLLLYTGQSKSLAHNNRTLAPMHCPKMSIAIEQGPARYEGCQVPYVAIMPTWQVLQGHIVDDLVIAALQEGGVDDAEGSQALARQPCCERHRMLLRDADVEGAVVEPATSRRDVIAPL